MTPDRELLEAAAKAAGVDGEYRTENLCPDGDWIDVTAIFFPDDQGWWDPLHDYGDALRLLESKQMTLAFEPTRGGWSVGAITKGAFCWLAHNDDAKRAIVCAAAAMVTS